MSLEREIQQHYSERGEKTGLYNSLYSELADRERQEATESLLKEYFKTVSGKSILEIGAGQGGNVPMLQSCGFSETNIYLNELLPERILAVRTNYPRIKLYAGDALKLSFEETYDCVFQSTVFTSILDEGMRKAMADKMWRLLKPGGIILWYDFIYNNPNNPHVRKVSIAGAKALFPGAAAFTIKKITLAPPIGRRVGRFYSLFNLPLLRSHILCAFQKPS